MPTITVIAQADDGLDWPSSTDDLNKVTIECAGKNFVDFYSLLNANHEELWSSLVQQDLDEVNKSDDDDDDDDDNDSNDDDKNDDSKLPPAVDLFSLSEKQLENLDYYQVLHLPYKPTITPDDVKKAYRKACLKYHPDKSGRDEEDAVFLKVKAAFETLSTSKLSYDSTEMPFDDSIPSPPPSTTTTSGSDPVFADFSDFLKEYGPVFERNAHFDAKLLPRQNSTGSGSSGGGRRKSRGGNKNKQQHEQGPPSIGDHNTPIEEVHAFYDYWTHFESWRDFSLQAARELEAEDQLENAESRYEKRWYEKEIAAEARRMKKAEVRRVATLVEQAMAVDPRLVQERKRLADEKKQKQREREQLALKKKLEEEQAKLAEEQRIEEEKKLKAEEKFAREKEKKMFRKTKQAFKKYVSSALEELLEKEYALEDEVDIICEKLDRVKLTRFNDRLDGKSASDVFSLIKKRAEDIKNGVIDDDEADAEAGDAPTSNGGTTSQSQAAMSDKSTAAPMTSSNTEKDSSSGKENGSKQTTSSSSSKTKEPFTKEELSALAKGVKKFPPGGANRWDQIANYVNNLCRPQNPRSKEECIEIYNQLKNSAASAAPAAAAVTESSPAATSKLSNDENCSSNDPDAWTTEQDHQLQLGLAKYPASMDKNERWAKIAEEVPGKTKKDCVQRFKAIRDALKAKK